MLFNIKLQPTDSQLSYFILLFKPAYYKNYEKNGIPQVTLLSLSQRKDWEAAIQAAFKFAYDELATSFSLSPLPKIHFHEVVRYSPSVKLNILAPVKIQADAPLDSEKLLNSPLVRGAFPV
jgi:hypothetical protein